MCQGVFLKANRPRLFSLQLKETFILSSTKRNTKKNKEKCKEEHEHEMGDFFYLDRPQVL